MSLSLARGCEPRARRAVGVAGASGPLAHSPRECQPRKYTRSWHSGNGSARNDPPKVSNLSKSCGSSRSHQGLTEAADPAASPDKGSGSGRSGAHSSRRPRHDLAADCPSADPAPVASDPGNSDPGKEAARKGRPGKACLLYTSPSPRDATLSRMPSSA